MAWYSRIVSGIRSFFRPSPAELGREPYPTEEVTEEEEEPPSEPGFDTDYPEYEEDEEDPYEYRDIRGITLYDSNGYPVGPYTWLQWRTIVYQDYDLVLTQFSFTLDSISIMKQLTARGLWTEEDWQEWREWYDAVVGTRV